MEIVSLLLQHEEQADEAFVNAAGGDHTELVRLLLQHGLQANVHHNDALVRAALHGHTELVHLLLRHGHRPMLRTARPLCMQPGSVAQSWWTFCCSMVPMRESWLAGRGVAREAAAGSPYHDHGAAAASCQLMSTFHTWHLCMQPSTVIRIVWCCCCGITSQPMQWTARPLCVLQGEGMQAQWSCRCSTGHRRVHRATKL